MSNNYEEAAMNDLNSREFKANQETEQSTPEIHEAPEEVKPTSLGRAAMFENRSDEPAMLPGYIEIWAEKFPSKGFVNQVDKCLSKI